MTNQQVAAEFRAEAYARDAHGVFIDRETVLALLNTMTAAERFLSDSESVAAHSVAEEVTEFRRSIARQFNA
jgi:hypothetical protein